MGFFSLLSFLVVTSLGTLYPVYLSYKAIKHNDLQSLEVLLMFWIVMGVINAAENTFGWLLSWLPFYYQIKSCFMLWLTLPQIQGSTYVYVTYVHPFLLRHEPTIDQWLVEAKTRSKAAGQAYFQQLLAQLKQLFLAGLASSQGQQPDPPPSGATDAPPDPSAYAFHLLRQLGPAAHAIFQPMQGALPDSLHPGRPAGPQLNVPVSRSRTTSQTSAASSRAGRPSGYQIPEYDEGPLAGSTATLVGGGAGRSSDSFRPTGYDEIGRDEASGSENEWLLRRPRLSDEGRPSSAAGRKESDHSGGRRSGSGGSSWFGWTNKPNEESKKMK